jgi:cytochrome c5
MFELRVGRLIALSLGLGLAATAVWAAAPQSSAPAAATVQAEAPQAIVERACQSCHDLGVITQARHSADEWPGVLQRMRSNGADLNGDELKQVQDYLAKNYSVKR